MGIIEYQLISTKDDGTFPTLKKVKDHSLYYDDGYIYHFHDHFEYEYLIFGDIFKLQDNYVEHYYVLSYDENEEIIGVMRLSSGSRKETAIPFDSLFTYLLLTGSSSFITIHNHPSNNSEKSNEDIYSDKQIKMLSDMLGIKYKDGLVITKKQVNALHNDIDKWGETVYEKDEEYEDYDTLINKMNENE